MSAVVVLSQSNHSLHSVGGGGASAAGPGTAGFHNSAVKITLKPTAGFQQNYALSLQHQHHNQQQQQLQPNPLQSHQLLLSHNHLAPVVIGKRPYHQQQNSNNTTNVLRPIDPNQMRPNRINNNNNNNALTKNHNHKHHQTMTTSHHQHPYHSNLTNTTMTTTTTAQQPISVLRRNARERNRVKQVNNGFSNLRQHIPGDIVTALTNGGRGASKKLSKVDTLKVAVEYIRRLQELLDLEEAEARGDGAGGDAAGGCMKSAMSVSSSLTSSMYYSSSSSSVAAEATAASTSLRRSQTSGTVSPTPSFVSDDRDSTSSRSGVVSAHPTHHQYKYEPYETYNPEDEELLDCISWWQQQ